MKTSLKEKTIVFNSLLAANVSRQNDWCGKETPDLCFRGVELAGETGEACNVIKKLVREQKGWNGSRDTIAHLAEELADVVICANLTAMAAGIDLDKAVENKFNATSEKLGFRQRLKLP